MDLGKASTTLGWQVPIFIHESSRNTDISSPSIWPRSSWSMGYFPFLLSCSTFSPGPTYRLARPGAGAEDGVLADHPVGLGWGEPWHDHTAGRWRNSFDASGGTWNWAGEGGVSLENGGTKPLGNNDRVERLRQINLGELPEGGIFELWFKGGGSSMANRWEDKGDH